MPTFSREQIQSARLQARVKRQEEIDQKHAEIARIREEGGDTEALLVTGRQTAVRGHGGDSSG